MGLFTLEHGKVAYHADMAVYGMAVVGLAGLLLVGGPADQRLANLGLALAGLASWPAIEYALHRFVLHGLQPFRGWHEQHHRRPTALISTPTLLSGGLIAGLVFAPALVLAGPWHACGLTLGVLGGYLAYTLTHHAMHHWRAEANSWLRERKRWHALHHRHGAPPACYGVTSGFWDRICRTTRGTDPDGVEPTPVTPPVGAPRCRTSALRAPGGDRPAAGARSYGSGAAKSPQSPSTASLPASAEATSGTRSAP